MENLKILKENATPIYLGIHDILTHYDTKKKAANAVKTAKHGVRLKNKSIFRQIQPKSTLRTKLCDFDFGKFGSIVGRPLNLAVGSRLTILVITKKKLAILEKTYKYPGK